METLCLCSFSEETITIGLSFSSPNFLCSLVIVTSLVAQLTISPSLGVPVLWGEFSVVMTLLHNLPFLMIYKGLTQQRMPGPIGFSLTVSGIWLLELRHTETRTTVVWPYQWWVHERFKSYMSLISQELLWNSSFSIMDARGAPIFLIKSLMV